MRRIWSSLALLVLLLGAGTAGCAGGAASQSEAATRPRSDPRRLTSQDIGDAMEQNVQSLFDLVQSRRPQWLRPPSTQGLMGRTYPVQVWLDRVRLGGVEQLRTIPLASVAEARFLTASEAQGELGMDNVGGAISVTSIGRAR